ALVVGLAREGTDLVQYLAANGADVCVTDRRAAPELAERLDRLARVPVALALGRHPLDPLDGGGVVDVRPAVPPGARLLLGERRRGLRVSSATELFLARCPAPIVGITGSSGKTTTTALTGEIFRHTGRKVFVGGNIGVPLLGQLAQIPPDAWVIMELSSF